MKNIILFASGNGTNAENICRHFQNHPDIRVAALFCNNPQAGVIARMKPFGVPVELFTKKQLFDPEVFLPMLEKYNPTMIVLAGFLLLIPKYLVNVWPMINIHPALLPKHGGKGMYGQHVHEAVIAAKDAEHGITIHSVNENFDEGLPLFQAKFTVTADDSVETVARKISELEMLHFPKVIELLMGRAG